jgi:DNA mismatch repair protein MLH1
LAKYRNGKILDAPKPIAGNQGTMITIEDLFYNVPTRKAAFKNLNEEYSKILDVCQKYSIHNPIVAFMCKKHGTNSWDICTPLNSTVLSNIGLLYGKKLVKELIPVGMEDSSLSFKTAGFISNANYSEKKFTFILFINGKNRIIARAKRELLWKVITHGFTLMVFTKSR